MSHLSRRAGKHSGDGDTGGKIIRHAPFIILGEKAHYPGPAMLWLACNVVIKIKELHLEMWQMIKGNKRYKYYIIWESNPTHTLNRCLRSSKV